MHERLRNGRPPTLSSSKLFPARGRSGAVHHRIPGRPRLTGGLDLHRIAAHTCADPATLEFLRVFPMSAVGGRGWDPGRGRALFVLALLRPERLLTLEPWIVALGVPSGLGTNEAGRRKWLSDQTVPVCRARAGQRHSFSGRLG